VSTAAGLRSQPICRPSKIAASVFRHQRT